MRKITFSPDPAPLRAKEYPPLQDFADAFYWMQKGDPAPMAAYVAKVDAIKAKYPKPSTQGVKP